MSTRASKPVEKVAASQELTVTPNKVAGQVATICETLTTTPISDATLQQVLVLLESVLPTDKIS